MHFLRIFVHLCALSLNCFDHNLHYMAPFAIPRAGFCTEFRRASSVFSSPGVDFGALGQISRPRG